MHFLVLLIASNVMSPMCSKKASQINLETTKIPVILCLTLPLTSLSNLSACSVVTVGNH